MERESCAACRRLLPSSRGASPLLPGSSGVGRLATDHYPRYPHHVETCCV